VTVIEDEDDHIEDKVNSGGWERRLQLIKGCIKSSAASDGSRVTHTCGSCLAVSLTTG